MAVYIRNRKGRAGIYWVRFRIGGRTVRQSAHTTEREKAEQFEQALRDRHWRQQALGEEVHTWREATQRMIAEAEWADHTRETNERYLALFSVIDRIPVSSIDRKVVEAARERATWIAEDGTRRESPRAPSSVARILAVFRQVLNACEEWGWLARAPKVRMPSIPERDPTWVAPERCERLIAELPAHQRAPVLFAILTGLRMANVRDLTWDRVDLKRKLIWIPSSSYKSRKPHALALSEAAVEVLRAIRRERGIEHVFTYRAPVRGGAGLLGDARPITGTLNTKAFRKARKRAGLEKLRWHDLRHTFASWLAMENASDRVLQSMMGWTSPAMARRYAHLRVEDLRTWASSVGTKVGTSLPHLTDKTPQDEE
jgi:integrase